MKSRIHVFAGLFVALFTFLGALDAQAVSLFISNETTIRHHDGTTGAYIESLGSLSGGRGVILGPGENLVCDQYVERYP